MNIAEYKEENAALRKRVAELEKANGELIIHNMQLGQKVDAYYDVCRRIHIYKELLARHTEFLRHADLRNDEDSWPSSSRGLRPRNRMRILISASRSWPI